MKRITGLQSTQWRERKSEEQTHMVKNLKRIEKARFPVSHFSRTAGF
jgi:hypothetical protein